MLQSAEVLERSVTADGRVQVRYRFTDSTSATHSTGTKYLPVDADIQADMLGTWAGLLESLRADELNWIELEVLAGRNSFSRLRYVSVDSAIKHVAQKLLSDPDLLHVARAAPLLGLFTDDELSGLLDVTPEKVANIRTAASRAMSVLQATDGYEAVL